MTKTLTYREQCHKAVTDLGGKVTNNGVGNIHCYELAAPDGYLWAANRMHTIVVAYRYGRNITWLTEIEEQWKESLNRVGHGIERCDVKNCEWCKS